MSPQDAHNRRQLRPMGPTQVRIRWTILSLFAVAAVSGLVVRNWVMVGAGVMGIVLNGIILARSERLPGTRGREDGREDR